MRALLLCLLSLRVLRTTVAFKAITSRRTIARARGFAGSPSRPALLMSTQSVSGETSASSSNVLVSTLLPPYSPSQIEAATKVSAWAVFAAAAYSLRSFMPIVTCTFFLSHIGSRLIEEANKLNKWTRRVPRKVFAAAYIVSVSSLLAYSVVSAWPIVYKEAQYYLRVVQSDNPYKIISNGVSGLLGLDVTRRLEQLLQYFLTNEGRLTAAAGERLQLEKLLQHTVTGYTEKAFAFASRLISSSTSVIYSSILSCIFSFMILWDLPRIGRGFQKLRDSRLGFVYNEVAPKVSSFGNLLGQTFEVQALTSLVNAVLTSLVIWALKIPGLGFFALLTFFSSFVPLLGIAISTTPPLIVALVERGFATCLQLVLLIAAVHTVEAYLLYPQIYAVKLKMHPVLVTGALVVAEHYFGIPGLVLAVPVTLFFSKQLFAKPEDASSAL